MGQEAATKNPIEHVIEQYETQLFRVANRIVGNPDKAREVVQETFLRLCQVGSDSVEGKQVEWLFTVCRNRAVDVLRADRRLRPLASDAAASADTAAEAPSVAVQRQRDARSLISFVSELPSQQRRIIVMRFHDGWSYRQISEATGTSVGNVGYQIHAALKNLRRRFNAAASPLGREE